MLRHLPNSITCANLLCGCIGIVQALQGQVYTACLLVGLAVVFDFLDGFAARLLHAASPIGKDLDSLADVVTFGVLPSVIVYGLMEKSLPEGENGWVAYVAFLIAVFSALRLAKFNNDPRQSEAFIGLPTPANAILVCSLPLIADRYPQIAPFVTAPAGLIALTLLMSFLLVAEIPLFALKFKSFGWHENRVRYGFLAVSALLLAVWQIIAIPVIIFLYIVVSLILRFTSGR